MENVTQKILGLLDQAQGLILQAKESLVSNVSEPAPENLEENIETPEVPETPENVTPAETTTAVEGNEVGEGEGSVGSQE